MESRYSATIFSWHVAQLGANLRPLFSSALPWMLSWKRAGWFTAGPPAPGTTAMFAWHLRQVVGRLKRFVRDAASFDGRMSWIPWQSVQVAALLAFDFPLSSACTLFRYSSTSGAWHVAQSTGASFS